MARIPTEIIFLIYIILCNLWTMDCSHFRGSVIMIRPTSDGSIMEISYYLSWRRGHAEGRSCNEDTIETGELIGGVRDDLVCFAGCERNNLFIVDLKYRCTAFSEQEQWSFGERLTNFTFPENAERVSIGFVNNAWVSPINGYYRLQTVFSTIVRNDTGKINSSPRVITSPVIKLQGGCNQTLQLPVSDPDGDIIRCRWSSGYDECGDACDDLEEGTTLDPVRCSIMYPAPEVTRDTFKAVAVTIEDFTPGMNEPLSSIGLQFLFLVTKQDDEEGGCLTKPQFVPPTYKNGICLAIPPDQLPFSIEIAVMSTEGSITEISYVGPSGMSKTELMQRNNSNVFFITLKWDVSSDQLSNEQSLCYFASNNRGRQSDQNCIALLPGVYPPQIVQGTNLPNNLLIDATSTVWTLKFDKIIQRPSQGAFVRFLEYETDVEVHAIDTSVSAEITINDDELQIVPDFGFEEKTKFYILLEREVVVSLEGCRPGNEPMINKDFWVFETLDVTPPTLDFVSAAERYNENVTVTWSIDEDNVTVVVAVKHIDTNTTVTGWLENERSWTSSRLKEGDYDMDIIVTDAAGNEAVFNHEFTVDTTPPTIVNFRGLTGYWTKDVRPWFRQACTELNDCHYECYFENLNTSEVFPLDCDWRVKNMSDTVHNTLYKYLVRPTDDVGNVGEWFTYEWRTDFEAPIIEGSDSLQTNCGESFAVEVIGGQVTYYDELDMNPTLSSYWSTREDCFRIRTWRTRDHAAHYTYFPQRINISYIDGIAILPNIRIDCNTASVRLNETYTLLNPHPDCWKKLQIVSRNDDQEYSCPGVHNISITIRDNCTGDEKTMYQRVELYTTCELDACGQNLTEPWGACRAGQCFCEAHRYGDFCQLQYFVPVIQPIVITVLDDSIQEYNQDLALLQGTEVVYWKLLEGPEGMKVDNTLIGHVTWEGVRCGVHNVTVEAKNNIGSDTMSWTVTISNSYEVSLNTLAETTLSSPAPVTLSGSVTMLDGSSTPNREREVVIDITGRAKRKISVMTDIQGDFSWVFRAPNYERGTFTASVRHPCQESGTSSVTWEVLSMNVQHKTLRVSGETFTETHATFESKQILTNDGPVALHGISLSLPDLSLYPDMDSLDIVPESSPTELQADQSLTYSITVIVKRPTKMTLSIGFSSQEGTYIIFDLQVTINQITPVFEISPNSIQLNGVRGSIKTASLRLTNTGGSEATNVRPVFPDFGTIQLSVVSFGPEGSESQGPFVLDSNSSAVLVISFSIPIDQPFGVGSGSLSISSNEVSKTVPISLSITSDIEVMVTLIIEDEYSYFANGRPLVTDAEVHIRNRLGYRKSLSSTQGNGTVTVTLPEGAYELYVSAPDHAPVQETRIFSQAEQVIRIFLQRQMVRYSWKVTPVLFEDTYIITLEADFETYVPAPVVTIEPNFIDTEVYELGYENSIFFNVTNHGLIRADDVSISLPSNHPTLIFSTELESIGDLEARSSVLVPYTVTRRSRNKRSSGCGGSYSGRLIYSYVCGTRRSGSISIEVRSRRTSGGCGLNPRGGGLNPRGGGPGGGGTLAWRGGTGGKAACDPCILSMFNDCVIGLIPGGSCVAAGFGTAIAAGTGDLGSVGHVGGLVGCGLSIVGSPVATPLGILFCIKSIVDCSKKLDEQRQKRGVKDVIYQYSEASEPFLLSLEIGIEILGDVKWFDIGDPDWFHNNIGPTLNDNSDDGILISDSEMQDIRSAPRPDGISSSDVRNLAERLKNTMYNWNNGKLERENENENMASHSYVTSRANEIQTLNENFVSQGFNSYVDALEYYRSELEKVESYEEPEGVCAVVRIRIEQELTLTREAFEASLEIDNQESNAIQEISLVIFITDTVSGAISTELFSFSNGSFSGSLTAVDGTGTLNSGEKGDVKYLIVPLHEAAPMEDKQYDIAGTLKYVSDGDEVSIPLFPTTVTVKPDPSLCVHYFWEKDVWSDDPFTAIVEPSIPIILAVVVQNQGYGMANDLKITSSQPEIIENDKGLLVTFEIVGSTVNGNAKTPSLTVDFGDVGHNETVMATWLLTSSLKGEFKNFSATFENINPLGDPRLSVLDCLEIHQMLRPVMLYRTEENDKLIDFLTNDRIDIYDNPEFVYSSQNLHRYPVQTFDASSLIPQNIGSRISFLIVIPVNGSGWIFSRYEDLTDLIETDEYTPVEGLYDVTHDTPVVLPRSNAWITSVKRGSRKVLFANVFFHAEVPGNYTLEVVISDETTGPSSVFKFSESSHFEIMPTVSLVNTDTSSTHMSPSPSFVNRIDSSTEDLLEPSSSDDIALSSMSFYEAQQSVSEPTMSMLESSSEPSESQKSFMTSLSDHTSNYLESTDLLSASLGSALSSTAAFVSYDSSKSSDEIKIDPFHPSTEIDIRPTETSTDDVSSVTPTPCSSELPLLPDTVSILPLHGTSNQNIRFRCSYTLPVQQESISIKTTFMTNNRSVYETLNPETLLKVTMLNDDLYDMKVSCCITLQYTNACENTGSSKCSVEFHINVELPTETVIVDESQEYVSIQMVPNIAANLLCGHSTPTPSEIYLRTNVQRANEELWCEMDRIPQVVFNQVGSAEPTCGSDVSDYSTLTPGSPLVLTVKPVLDGVIDGNVNRTVAVSLVKSSANSDVCSIDLGSITLSIVDRTPAQVCEIFGVSAITTYNSLSYYILTTGEFVLFRNSQYNVECHTQTVLCSLLPPIFVCTCSVTCRIGDDVVKITKCPTRSNSFLPLFLIPVRIYSYINGQPPTNVDLQSSLFGERLDLTLPTGTTLTVYTTGLFGLHVLVKPSSTDVGRVSGLCNTLSGTSERELVQSDGTPSSYDLFPEQFIESWRVTEINSLYRGAQASTDTPDVSKWCSCIQDYQAKCSGTGYIYKCSRSLTTIEIFRAPFAYPSRNRRVKRQTDANQGESGPYENVDPQYTVQPNNINVAISWPTASGIALAEATSQCRNAIEGDTSLKDCLDMGNVDTTSRVEFCVNEVGRVDNTSVVSGHTQFLKELCEALIDKLANMASDAQTALDNDPNAALRNNLCPLSCSGHGACVRGICNCNSGYTGYDCSVEEQGAPSVTLIQNNPCNVGDSECKNILVHGENFIDGKDLTCHLTQSLDKIITVKGSFVTSRMIQCSVPEVRNFMIAISNDGNRVSETQVLYVTYNSECSRCTLNSLTDVSCTIEENICLIDNKCRSVNVTQETNDCLVCNPSDNQYSWSVSSNQDCDEKDDESSSLTQLHIIIIVVAVVVLLLLLTLVAFLCFEKNKKSERESWNPTTQFSDFRTINKRPALKREFS